MALSKIKPSSIQDFVNPENIRSDLMSVALQQAITENKTSYNLPNAFIDQFENSNGVDTTTNTSVLGTEAVSSKNKSPLTVGVQTGTPTHRTDKSKFGSSSINLDYQNYLKIDGGASGSFDFGTGDFTIDGWFNRDNFAPWGTIWELTDTEIGTTIANAIDILGKGDQDQYYYARVQSPNVTDQTTAGGYQTLFSHNTWVHFVVQRYGTKFQYFRDGSRVFDHTMGSGSLTGLRYLYIGYGHNQVAYGGDGGWDDFRVSDVARYTSSTYTVPTSRVSTDSNTVFLLQSQSESNGSTTFVDTSLITNTTGNFTSVNQSSNSSVSDMGIIILYKNVLGTATLNSDLVAQVSADGGSNYSTCTLEDVGNFSASLKIARAVGVSVTAGTTPKYKISFANQSAGSKETEVHGVGLLY